MIEATEDHVRRAQQRVGQLLKEKWRIDRVLGVGGFGAVYAATHRTRKRVAIKILHPEVSASAEMRARFLREAYAANSVEHPGVVSVFDDDATEDGSAFLVMELCEGEGVDVRSARSGGRLPVPEVIFIADQVLDVLAVAHERGIVHRDVKPANLFVARGGQIKVLDFGIARFREVEGVSATRTGHFLGTPAFMSPEQARGEWQRVDGRSDLWAVGATMFVLLTGRTVHGARFAPEMLVAAMTQPAPPLASVLPGVPAPLADIVDRALAFDPLARWPDARQMQAALRRASSLVLGTATPSGPHVEVTQPSPPMNRAEAIAFANTLANEKTPVRAVAPGSPPVARPWLRGIALAAGVLVVGAGLSAGAQALLAAKGVTVGETPKPPTQPETATPAPPPPAASPEPSALPTATAVATTPTPPRQVAVPGSTMGLRPSPGPKAPADPAAPSDPFSRRR